MRRNFDKITFLFFMQLCGKIVTLNMIFVVYFEAMTHTHDSPTHFRGSNARRFADLPTRLSQIYHLCIILGLPLHVIHVVPSGFYFFFFFSLYSATKFFVFYAKIINVIFQKVACVDMIFLR